MRLVYLRHKELVVTGIVALVLCILNSCSEFTAVSSEKGKIKKIVVFFLKSDVNCEEILGSIQNKFSEKAKNIGVYYVPANALLLKKLKIDYPKAYPYNNFREMLKNFMDTSTYNEMSSDKTTEFIFSDELTSLTSINQKYQEKIKASIRKEILTDYALSYASTPDTYDIEIIIDFIDNYEDIGLNDLVSTNSDQPDIWIQDHFISRQKRSGQQVVCDLIYSNNKDYCKRSASLVAKIPGICVNLIPSKYKGLQGGNFLFSDSFMVIGKDVFYLNLPQTDSNKIVSDFKTLFNKPHIIWTGFNKPRQYIWNEIPVLGHQPLFHIDMYITLGGEDNGKQLIYIAESDTNFYDPFFIRNNPEAKKIITEIGNMLDSVKYDFISHNEISDFKIERIPLLLVFYQNNTTVLRYLSYNNSIIENYNTHSYIYMPYYEGQMGPHDQLYSLTNYKADSVYAIYGNVQRMDFPFDELGNGSLHCVTNVLYRTKN